MPNPNVEPLAQDFHVVAQVPNPTEYFFHDPNMTRLDDGALGAADVEIGVEPALIAFLSIGAVVQTLFDRDETGQGFQAAHVVGVVMRNN